MLEIQVLGAFTALRDGVSIQIRGDRPRALLSRLVCADGHGVTRESLIEDLWGDAAKPSALNAVQVTVSGLRKQLGREVITTTPVGYRLGGEVHTDLAAFTAAVRAADERVEQQDDLAAAAGYAVAVGLWSGTPLDAVVGEFVVLERARLQERRLDAAVRLAACRVRLGAFAAVVDDLAPLVRLHPFREDLIASYVLALAGVGRRIEALDLLEATRSRLLEEFGVGVSTALSDAQLQVLQDEAARATSSTPPPRRAVPHLGIRRVPPPLVGRDGALKEVVALLDRADVRLVTVLGPAGVGKSRLAEAVVETSAQDAAFASMLSAEQADDVMGAIAHELGIPADPGGPEEAVIAALRAPSSVRLLVLDNLEHLDAAPQVVERLLVRVPSLTVLTTSREPLYLPSEHRYGLAPFPVTSARSSASVRIFEQVARRANPQFEVRRHELADFAQVLQACEGLPLAIELAAAWVGVLSMAELRLHLVDRLAGLTDPRSDAVTRRTSIRASIEWSVDRLPDHVRSTLQAASVFAGGFTVDGLAAVAGITTHDARRHLVQLVDRNLVLRTADELGRFDLLHGIRETLLARGAPAQLLALRHAHLRHVHSPFASVPRSRAHPATVAEFAELRAAQLNIRSAVRFALTHDPARFADLVTTISTGWVLLGYEEEIVGWATAGLRRDDLTPLQQFDCLLALERGVGLLGGDRSAELLRSLTRLGADVDRDRRLALWIRVAYAAFFAEDLAATRRHIDALQRELARDDEIELGLLTEQLAALVLVSERQYDTAIQIQRSVVARAREGRLDLLGRSFAANLTQTLLWAGRGEEAERLSLQLLSEADSEAVFVRASAIHAAGLAQVLRGEYARARTTLLLALGAMRGSLFDGGRLTTALAFATGLLAPISIADQHWLLAIWQAWASVRGSTPTPLERRLLDHVVLEPDETNASAAPEQRLAESGLSGLATAAEQRIRACAQVDLAIAAG